MSNPTRRNYKHVSLDDGALEESLAEQPTPAKEDNLDSELKYEGDFENEKLHTAEPLYEGEGFEPNLITIDDAIERIGIGKFQYVILIASGLCFAADAMQVILLSFLTIVLKDEWDLSDSMTESITSCLFAGSMMGTLILGPLADSMGRRPIFLVAALIISIFGFGTALATDYFMLVAMLFMVGIGVGGLTVPFDILAEFLPSHNRGTNLLLINYFWTIGVLLVVVLAYFTLHGEQSHWRLLVALSSLPCFVSVIVGYLFVPESARWLVTQGRSEEALQVMRDGAAMNGHDVTTLFPEGIQLMAEPEEKQATIADLLKPKWREITLRLWGGWGAFAFGYYGTLLAITRVFDNDQGSSTDGNSDSYNFDYGAIFVSSSAELVGTTLVILLVDRAGRISTQVLSYSLAGILICILCSLASYGAPRLLLIALGFAARVFEMGGTCVTWVSTAEILTTEVRSTGHSTANAMARLGAFFCPFVVEGSIPLRRIGYIMLFVHMITVLCVSKLPETKGRSMGDTDNSHDDEQEETDGVILVPDDDTDDAEFVLPVRVGEST
jgi:MFS family permease